VGMSFIGANKHPAAGLAIAPARPNRADDK
jgi:hypothetical protein